MNNDSSKYYGYVEDVSEVMYSGCKHTRLNAIVSLFHIECLNRVIDKPLIC